MQAEAVYSFDAYGCSNKFRFYRTLPSFREYLILAQDELLAEHWVRQADGAWRLREFASLSDEIELTSIGCRLRLGVVYERIEFDAAPTAG